MSNRRTFLKTAIAAGTAGLAYQAPASANTPSAKSVDRRILGRTGVNVSILGLGLGSAFTKPYTNDRENGQALLHRALDHGINYWDTSLGYGKSEEIISPVLTKRRDEIFLVTKSDGRTYDAFMKDFETSLNTLGTDHVDLMHVWNVGANEDLHVIEKGAYKAIQKLKDEKAISHFGITGHSGAAILMDLITRIDPDAILTVFPCTRSDEGRYENELLPLARDRNMGVIAMKTVRHAREADLRGSDLVRYALSLDGVKSTIVGLDSQAHLDENIQMATNFKPMSNEERAELHSYSVRALAGIQEPWLRPGYRDGALV